MYQKQILPAVLLAATAVFLGLSPASAQVVSSTFNVDNASSNVTVTISALGGNDSDSSPLIGNINSSLTFDTSGGTPLITGLNFTGGVVGVENTTVQDVPILGFANLHIESTGVGGPLTTIIPPGAILPQNVGNTSYTFSAAQHQLTFNQGVIEVSDFQTGTVNLADVTPPVGGPGPVAPTATINLTQGATYHNFTLFNAQVTYPVNFTSLVPLDDTNDATINAVGQIVANGIFPLDIGMTGGRELLLPSDRILAIDLDGGSASASPTGEGPENTVDGTAALKYVNLAGSNSGFIVTPSAGSSQVQSLRFTSANDFPERDPATWELYGTNDAITSVNNSLGSSENWTLVDTGSAQIPDTRLTAGSIVGVDNASTFSSYKVIFPTTKNLNDPVLHLAEAEFFASTDGTGADLLGASSPVLAIDEDFIPESNYPNGESPTNLLDGDSNTKYLNQGGKNSGFIVTPTLGSSVVDGFQITTANDFELRDPAAWELYGTNDAVTSTDNSRGEEENWTLIDDGSFTASEVPEARFAMGDIVDVSNSSVYSSYRLLFTDLRDANDPLMQIADIQFFGDLIGESADFNMDGNVDGSDFLAWQRGFGSQYDAGNLADWRATYGATSSSASASVVPEPSALALSLLFLGPGLMARRS